MGGPTERLEVIRNGREVQRRFTIVCSEGQRQRNGKSMDLFGMSDCNDLIVRLRRPLDGSKRLVAPRLPVDLSPDRRCHSVRGNIDSHLQETAKLDPSMCLGVLLRLFVGLPPK